MRLTPPVVLLLAGCGDAPPKDTASREVDADGDGLGASVDCDDGDPNVGSDPFVWYADVDEDGFGDPGATLSACTAPGGYVADASDCDDGDAEVNPEAVERCGGDGAAVLFEGPLHGGAVSDGDALLVGSLYNDGAGTLVALADLNGDGRDDVVITDPHGGSSTASVTSGLVHILTSPVSGTITLGESVLGDDDATITADSRGCELGSAIHLADADGDGRADVLVGAPEAYNEYGEVYLLYGPLSGVTSLGDVGVGFKGTSAAYPIGNVVLLADRSGDGVPDMLMSADGAGAGGVVYGFLGANGL